MTEEEVQLVKREVKVQIQKVVIHLNMGEGEIQIVINLTWAKGKYR